MTEPQIAAGPAVAGFRATWDRLRRYPGLIAGVVFVTVLVLAGFFAPLPHDPVQPNVFEILKPPSSTHIFGTDLNGFDVFSRTIDAAQRILGLAPIGRYFTLHVGNLYRHSRFFCHIKGFVYGFVKEFTLTANVGGIDAIVRTD